MTAPAPDHALQACVVLPARDEEALVGRCLRALATQHEVDPASYLVIIVLDDCRDHTRDQALALAAEHPELRLCLLEGPGRGVGHARRIGMDAAAARLRSANRPHGLIACTDADSVVDRSWLAAQIGLAAGGAVAIGGRIDILPEDQAMLPRRVLEVRRLSAERRRRRAADRGGRLPDHGFFSGASMSVTASLYAQLGGLHPLVALEDEALEQAVQRHGVTIARPNAVRVQTSGRVQGRAPLGLAHDLATALSGDRGQ